MVKLESTGDGNYQLTSSYPWDQTRGGVADPPVNFHGLENNMSQVDVWVNDNLRGTFLTTFETWDAANSALGFIQNLVSRMKDNSTFDSGYEQSEAEACITGGSVAVTVASGTGTVTRTNNYSAWTLPGGVALSTAQQNLLIEALRGVACHGVQNSIQYDTIYQRRITAASYNQIQASFVGVGDIWTTAEVIAFEGTPGIWWFQLPSDYLWLKAKPRVQTVAWQKTEIEYQYYAVKEAWSLLYKAYNAATLLSFT